MPIGRIGHAAAEPDVPCHAAPPGEDVKRVGRDRHLQRVMFGGPGDLETGVVGHADHLCHVIADILDPGRGVHALKVDGDMKLHDVTLV